MSQQPERSDTVPFYRAGLDLVYDDEWTDATVTLRQDGAVKYVLPYGGAGVDGADGDKVNRYRGVLLGDTGSDAYSVFVNGGDTLQTVTLDAAGLDRDELIAAAEYYIARVTVGRDNAPWSGAGVELYRDGARAYTLVYDADDGLYVYPYILKRASDDLFNVRITGSISGDETALTVSEPSPAAEADYYTVTYRDHGAVYLTQTVKSGFKASEPAAPYHSGNTFLGWRSNSADVDDANPLYDFETATVSSATTIYASFDAPAVAIGGYVKC
ncbi:MAG: InlB B-repeat-containing protein, partial [Oscillospiraceae bacterium]|nr:InlB B-repeat-containing protein [Oscillospiraceae bacterium]